MNCLPLWTAIVWPTKSGVINDDLDKCYDRIIKLIMAEKNKDSKDYDLEFIRNHIEKLTS